MTDLTGPQVFRPGRGGGVVCLTVALVLSLFVVCWPWQLGPGHPGWWLGLGAALMSLLLGTTAVFCFATRVTVSSAGLTKTPRWTYGYTILWSSIEAWSVGWHDAMEGSRLVRLRVSGRRLAMVVLDAEVECPGFDAFVATLRTAIGDREVPDTGQYLPVATAAIPPRTLIHNTQTGRLDSWT